MPHVTARVNYDAAVERQALRKAGLLGRGGNSNSLFAIDIDQLPKEARETLDHIVAGGPFPYPHHDGKWFQNRFGDLPNGEYLEFTVPTPGASNRGARRIVGRKSNGMAFFTACHYDRRLPQWVLPRHGHASRVSGEAHERHQGHARLQLICSIRPSQRWGPRRNSGLALTRYAPRSLRLSRANGRVRIRHGISASA